MSEPYREVARTTRPDGVEVIVVESTDTDPGSPMHDPDTQTGASTPATRWYSALPTRFILSVLLIAVGTLAMIAGVGMALGWWEALITFGAITLIMGSLLGYDGTD